MASLDKCIIFGPCPYSNCTCKNCPYSLQYVLRWKANQSLAVSSNLIISSDIYFYDLK